MSTLFTSFLYLHIAGAGAIGLMLIFTVFSLINKYQKQYRSTAVALSALTAFQLITGAVMTLIHPIPVQRFCLNISIYVALIFVAEYFLLMQSKKSNFSFPLVPVVSLFLFGVTGVLFSFFRLYI